MSCCVKSAARKPLFQTARFNLILRQDKLYKAAFSAPVFWERGHLPPFQKRPGPSFCPYTRERPCSPRQEGFGSRLQRRRNQSCFSRQEGFGSPSKRRRKPPRSPPKEGGGTLLVSPGRRASEAALLFSKGGPRNSPHFISLPASFLPSRKGLSPAFLSLLCKKKTGEQPLAPGKDLLRPAGGQGRTKNTGPKQRVPFKGFPSGLRWFRTIPEECPDPVGKVFRPACGGSGISGLRCVQAHEKRDRRKSGLFRVRLGRRRQTRRSRGPAIFFRVRGAQPSSEELWAAS